MPKAGVATGSPRRRTDPRENNVTYVHRPLRSKGLDDNVGIQRTGTLLAVTLLCELAFEKITEGDIVLPGAVASDTCRNQTPYRTWNFAHSRSLDGIPFCSSGTRQ